MALFSSKKKTETRAKASKPSPEMKREMGEVSGGARPARTVILRPRITEKATVSAEQNIYTFDVNKKATKSSVAAAVWTLFKVRPVKVSVIPVRGKRLFARGKKGVTRSGKKAYVYLKKGDTIEFV